MADSAKDLQFREMKDTITELNKLIATLQETIEELRKEQSDLREERDTLKEQVDYLTKKLFAPSSEKNAPFPGQLTIFNLFNEAEQESEADKAAEAAAEAEETEKKPKTRRPRKDNIERFKGLPVEKVYLDVPEEDRVCPVCGTPLEKIGEELVRRELQFVRPKVKVIEYYSINYGCPSCKESSETPYIIKGKTGHSHKIHGMASPSTVAWVMYQKYFNGMPLSRQERDWAQCGASIDRATLANWVIQNSDAFFRPMYEYFRRVLLKREFIMADETPVQVLHEPNRKAQSQSYMWLFRSGEDGESPVVIYKYSETRAGDNAKEFLEGFKGYIMCDGYSGYNKLGDAKRTTCWAHIRRMLIDAVPKGKEMDYTQPSVQGVMYVNRLFDKEKEIQEKNTDYDAIREARIKEEKPLIEGFLAWLDKQSPARNSRMDKAVTYIRNRKPYIMTYLEDGRCSFTNNKSENSLRPFVIGRQGWLFSDQPAGAEASAMCYTMVETAKANGINVYGYLTYLLEKQPDMDMTDEKLEEMAPWNEKVKEEVNQMATEL